MEGRVCRRNQPAKGELGFSIILSMLMRCLAPCSSLKPFSSCKAGVAASRAAALSLVQDQVHLLCLLITFYLVFIDPTLCTCSRQGQVYTSSGT